MEVVKPILKWVGGKTQIIDLILSKFPKVINNYHEPFVGGGSVLLGFLTLVVEGHIELKGNVYASDKNEALISLYVNVQQYPDKVINELNELVEAFSQVPDKLIVIPNDEKVNRKPENDEEARQCKEQFYYWIRRLYNRMSKEEKVSPKGTAHFIFLNKTCFRGVYREGPNGFNVPYGNYNNPSIFDEDHILIVSSLLQGVIFTTQGFETSLSKISESDFVYLDPPYAPETTTSFVGYTADGFNGELHNKLFKMCDGMTNIPNVTFIMSNSDVQVVRTSFPNNKYNIEVVNCRRAINSKKPQSTTNEVIIMWL
jgi:DNA adenine methylase